MKMTVVDRRGALRHNFKVPLRVRVCKSAIPEQRTRSENLSGQGIYFATNSQLRIGTTVEVLLKMPTEISGLATTEWLCSGHVVRVEPFDSPRGSLGVGVQFDCYEIGRSVNPGSSSALWQVAWHRSHR
jgi:Tfp pilus assembly protein PilZ